MRRTVACLVVLLAGAGPARAESFLGLYSRPGEPIGGGAHRILDAGDGELSVEHRLGVVDVTFVERGGRTWMLRFTAPAGRDLQPGLYADVERAGAAPGARPGLAVSSDTNACARVAGRFTVVAARYAADGTPLEFAATFEQRCDGAAAPLYGTVSFGGSLPVPATPTRTPTASPFKSFIQLDREPGGYFGEIHQVLTPADGRITVVHEPGYLSVVFDGRDYRAFTFAAPRGEELVAGVYENARRYPFQPPIWPGLDSGGPCNMLAGRFAILEADYAPDGSVRHLAINFEEYCEFLSPPLIGIIRFSSEVSAGAPTPTAPTATPTPLIYDTYVEMLSEPGDYIGGGLPHTLVPSMGLFTAEYADGHLAIRFDGDVDWSFDFAAPQGRELLPGHYTGVTRFPFHSPARGGLDVSGQSNGCDTLLGDFVVFEAAFDADGTVERFAANFEQYCNGSPAALRGVVRIRSDVAAGAPTPTPAPPTPTPTGPSTAIRIDSDPFEYIGEGRTYLLTDADGLTTATYVDGTIAIDYQGGGEDWAIHLAAPLGEVLVPGAYELAQQWPFQAPRRPGLSVDVTGRRCGRVSGRFDILELEVDDDGVVQRLAVDLEQRCDLKPPALHASIRIHSDIPLRPAPGPTPTPDPTTTYLRIDDRLITTSQATFFSTVTLAPDVVSVSVDSGPDAPNGESWSLVFAAPACEGLVPRTYRQVELYPSQAAHKAGFVLLGNGRRCGSRTGVIEILELEIGPNDEVLRFAADFDSCFGDGAIRYVSELPRPPATPTPIPHDYSDYAHLRSAPGDSIGQCRERELTTAEGVFTAEHIDESLVLIRFRGEKNWRFQFLAPEAALAPGTYDAAGGGLRVSGEGRSCDRITGHFTIQEIALAPDGVVERFAADFEQHCGGGPPALSGLVRYHSTLGPPTPVPSGAPTRTPALPPCVGDCGGDGQVTVGDVLAGVLIAIGSLPLGTCPASDVDGNGDVSIADLVNSMNRALSGCVTR